MPTVRTLPVEPLTGDDKSYIHGILNELAPGNGDLFPPWFPIEYQEPEDTLPDNLTPIHALLLTQLFAYCQAPDVWGVITDPRVWGETEAREYQDMRRKVAAMSGWTPR